MSKRNHITQAEARRLRREVASLHRMLDDVTSAYGREYPGTYLTTVEVDATLGARLTTARQLGHVIIARLEGRMLRYYAAEKHS